MCALSLRWPWQKEGLYGRKKLKKVIICVDMCEIYLEKCVFCIKLGHILWQIG